MNFNRAETWGKYANGRPSTLTKVWSLSVGL